MCVSHLSYTYYIFRPYHLPCVGRPYYVVACPLKFGIIFLEETPVSRLWHNKQWRNNWIRNANATDGSTAGNGVLCGSEPIVTSCSNSRTWKRSFLSGPYRRYIKRANRTSQQSSCEIDASQRRSWEPPACENVSPRAEKCPLLENVAQQTWEELVPAIVYCRVCESAIAL
jgi:hypothetical protein